MDKDTKKTFVGVLVPIVLVVLTVIFAQFSFVTTKGGPKYDFLYFIEDSVHDRYGLNDKLNKSFSMEQGKIIIYDDSVVNSIRLYDVSENLYKRVNRQELESMIIETQSVSPDGYSMEFGQKTSVDTFIIPIASTRTDYSKVYLKKKGSSSVLLNLGWGNGYYNKRDKFIGWVEPAQ